MTPSPPRSTEPDEAHGVGTPPAGRRAIVPGTAGLVLVFLVVLIALAAAALTVGSVPIPATRILAAVGSALGLVPPAGIDAQDAMVLWSIRLPRVVLALAAGAGLSVSGAILQAIFRNPLADPMLIGVSSGAALAVSAVIVVAGIPDGFVADGLRLLGPFALPVAGFIGGLAATALLYRIATVDGATSLATMLLAGIAINALAFAGIGILTTIASNEQLRNIAFWNFGSLDGVGWDRIAIVAAVALFALVAAMRLAPGLDALALGEREARHLGFDTQRLKRSVIVVAALAAGFVVAVCGVIGFVALVAPQIARLVFGVAHRAVVPGSAAFGAGLLLLADLFGRTVARPAELPIGVVTALVGAPFFLWMLVRQRARFATLP